MNLKLSFDWLEDNDKVAKILVKAGLAIVLTVISFVYPSTLHQFVAAMAIVSTVCSLMIHLCSELLESIFGGDDFPDL